MSAITLPWFGPTPIKWAAALPSTSTENGLPSFTLAIMDPQVDFFFTNNANHFEHSKNEVALKKNLQYFPFLIYLNSLFTEPSAPKAPNARPPAGGSLRSPTPPDPRCARPPAQNSIKKIFCCRTKYETENWRKRNEHKKKKIVKIFDSRKKNFWSVRTDRQIWGFII